MSERRLKMAKAASRVSLDRGLPSYEAMLTMEAYHQAYAREALIWCAIERFQMSHGRIPDELSELVPDFVGKMPCDPVNGLPLRYVRKGEADYLLYSVGWNEKDDGGVRRKKYREEGDWVWSSNPKLIVNPDEEKRLAEEKAEKESAKRGLPRTPTKPREKPKTPSGVAK